MPDCIFCKIAKREIPSKLLYEDDYAFAILDIRGRAPGHAMVIPKRHAPTILELPEEEIGPVFATVKIMTEKLRAVLVPDGFTIGINHGDASGQTVKHLHIHIIPRWKDDQGGSIHSVVDNPAALLEELENQLQG